MLAMAGYEAQSPQERFPDEILQDLCSEDILACREAMQVVVSAQEYENELCVTGIAVKLPGDDSENRNRWKLFHHFRWQKNPGFYGTEALQIWPAYRSWKMNLQKCLK